MILDEIEPKSEASKAQVGLVVIKRDFLPEEVLVKISRQKDLVEGERFLFEAVGEIKEDVLLKVLVKNKWETTPLENRQAEEGSREPGDIEIMSKPKVYTISAVGHLIPSRFYDRIKYAPLVRLSGFWLKKYGFQVGGKFLVYPSKDQLILRTGSAIDEDLGITLGGSNNG